MESFEAHWGVPGGVIQTIVGSQLRSRCLPSPPRISHELHLKDQGRAIIYEIEPKNISSMVNYLLTDDADKITGQIFNIDSGMSSIKL